MAAAAGLYALARGGKGGDEGPKSVTVEKGSITEKALAVGQIQPRQKFSVKSKISGIVKTLHGQRRRQGQGRATPCSRSHPIPTPQELTDVDRQLDSAKASYERARAEFERSQELLEAAASCPSPTSTSSARPSSSPGSPWPRPSRAAT